MGKAILVEKTIDDGRELLRAIDEEGLPVSVAMWLYQPETNDWQFVIATELVDTKGTTVVYGRVRKILDSLDGKVDIETFDVAAWSPRDEKIRALRTARPGLQGVTEVHLQRSAFRGVYLGDAFVYRIERPQMPLRMG